LGEGHRAESLIRDLSAEEQDESAKLLLASSLLIQQKRREAVDVLVEIERARSEDEQTWLSLGGLFLKAGEEQRGLEAYRRAIQVPTSGARSREQADVFNAVGHLLAQRGDLSSSAGAFRKAVERNPALASGHNNLGIVLARMKQFDAAERSFERALQEAPRFAEAYYNLGCLYLESGRNQRAIQVLRRALDIKPDYANAKAKLEQALAKTNPEDDGASRPPIPF
jgi:Tfp pilus assembly protein PilF